MGICSSCEATAVCPAATAKLILADGELREFDRPVKASSVLEKGSEWFVCDADDMEFDGFVSAVGSEEELRLGQIYFVLPRSMLRRQLRAEELAALAVKASAALMNGRSAVAPLVFGVGAKAAAAAEGVKMTVGERRRRSKREANGRGRNFATDLTAIPE